MTSPTTTPAPDPSNTPIDKLIEPIDPNDDVLDRVQLIEVENTEPPLFELPLGDDGGAE